MYNNLNEERYIKIYVDKKNIAVFPKVKNPDYDEKNEESAMYVLVKKPFELQYPYTQNDVAELIKKGIEAWGKGEPYIEVRKTIEEHYYNIKGFKRATLGKRLISVGWDDIGGKQVDLFMPMKSGKCYMGIASYELSENADWMDFAKVVMECIDVDVTELDTFKIYKKRLNI